MLLQKLDVLPRTQIDDFKFLHELDDQDGECKRSPLEVMSAEVQSHEVKDLKCLTVHVFLGELHGSQYQQFTFLLED